MNLRVEALNGIKWTSFSSIYVAIINLVQIAILTRYLMPSDFGLIAIVTVVIGFSALFMDMGISSAIIHRQDISHDQLSSLYWFNVFVGILLCLIVYFSSSIISQFYDEIELIPLIQLLSPTFLISALGNQFRILSQKKLLFHRLAIVDILSASISFAVAVNCAMNGFGVYSIVFAMLTNVSVSNLIFLVIGLKDQRPKFIYKHAEIVSFLKFGMFQIGEKSINYFNSQFDILLIGKLLGTEALGIYNVAKTLVIKPAQIINPIVTRVLFPVLSKVQNNIKQLKNIYLKIINYLCSVNFPIYIAIVILAEPLVSFLFGDLWLESIAIVQILSLYFMIRSIVNPIGSLQLAKGRADLGFYWNLGILLITPLAIYLGSFYDLIGISMALFVQMVIINFLNWYFMVEPLCEAQFGEYFTQIRNPLIIALVSSVLGLVISFVADDVILNTLLFIATTVLFYIFLNIKAKTPLYLMSKEILNT